MASATYIMLLTPKKYKKTESRMTEVVVTPSSCGGFSRVMNSPTIIPVAIDVRDTSTVTPKRIMGSVVLLKATYVTINTLIIRMVK